MADSAPKQEILVSGMTCGHCRAAVESAIREIPGVHTVHVDLEQGRATFEGHVDVQTVMSAVEEAGYEATPATAR